MRRIENWGFAFNKGESAAECREFIKEFDEFLNQKYILNISPHYLKCSICGIGYEMPGYQDGTFAISDSILLIEKHIAHDEWLDITTSTGINLAVSSILMGPHLRIALKNCHIARKDIMKTLSIANFNPNFQ